ncbi:hypothetical protein LF41_1850 [Lysobacter dokdonensis DS-58]|uniref:Lipoprotein n=1 Tax=Lysobacter dokdonensis DS-58 TaxID=1300345 RepID=A0A0A2WCX9_9GAMM|nr:hypothetical protein [Lysobacter dokdonensis]KGQ17996.1 hypothetical protein LF41_1850 [Lysobacter dokdonensis DS-58]
MSPVRLAAIALVAALPLAGCGNKGQLILNPKPQEMPPEVAAASSSIASPATVAPPSPATFAPPETSVTPPANTYGTSGTPR